MIRDGLSREPAGRPDGSSAAPCGMTQCRVICKGLEAVLEAVLEAKSALGPSHDLEPMTPRHSTVGKSRLATTLGLERVTKGPDLSNPGSASAPNQRDEHKIRPIPTSESSQRRS